MKKIKNCVKCNREIMPKEETFRGLCWECYKEYLLNKIEHMNDEKVPLNSLPKEKFHFKDIPKKISEFIHEIFNDF